MRVIVTSPYSYVYLENLNLSGGIVFQKVIFKNALSLSTSYQLYAVGNIKVEFDLLLN